MNGIAFLTTPFANSSKPNIELQSIGVGSVFNDVMKELSNYRPETWESFKPPNHNTTQEGFLIAVSLLAEKSVGRIELKSTDPYDAPVIDLNYFSKAEDVDILAQGNVRHCHNNPDSGTVCVSICLHERAAAKGAFVYVTNEVGLNVL
jgi:choline dehydrogenase-like flavoprotein